MRDCTRAADGVSFDTDRCDWVDRVLGVRVGVVSDEERVRRDGGDGEDVVVGVRDIGRRVCGGEFSDRDLVRGGGYGDDDGVDVVVVWRARARVLGDV